jgi:hypothetical protein
MQLDVVVFCMFKLCVWYWAWILCFLKKKELLKWSTLCMLNTLHFFFVIGCGSDFRLGKSLANWGSEFHLNFERVDGINCCIYPQESLWTLSMFIGVSAVRA